MQGQLLWLDMEMTGLEPDIDRVLEVAVIATNWDFTEIANFETGVWQDVEEITPLLEANPFYVRLPDNKKALLELTGNSPLESEVETQLINFVTTNCDVTRPVLLAGNSIHQDRRFIRHYYPRLDALLHYRMLDVSAWKVVFEGKFKKRYPKKDIHRALDDVRESIAELKFYLDNLK
ncbi:MAG TPA: oligoribonuclease [Candidatus Saccharimonadales bacterium]|jgi:oligoribonuclease|nr:oligoribonuclease [Candidatus Saccharimonadales bacterium]